MKAYSRTKGDVKNIYLLVCVLDFKIQREAILPANSLINRLPAGQMNLQALHNLRLTRRIDLLSVLKFGQPSYAFQKWSPTRASKKLYHAQLLDF